MTYIIVKNFQPHYNSAMDKVITSERQYKEEMKRGGYIPYEEAQERDANRSNKRNQFGISDEAVAWMKGVRSKADRKGNVKLSDREIEVLKKGATTNRENPALKAAQAAQEFDSRLPAHYRR